jgi:hypothetical protein
VVGASACRNCFEPIGETIRPARVAASHTQPLPPAFPRTRGRTFGGKLFVGVLAGLVVAAGLLVVDSEARRLRWPAASDIRLVAREVPTQKVTFRAPLRWEPGRRAFVDSYRLADARRGRDRAMVVQSEPTMFDTIEKRIGPLNKAEYLDYRPLETRRTRVAARDAVRHSFIGDDLQHIQVWIERGKGVVRVEFTFHPAEGDDAADLARRIAATMRIA